MSSHSAEHRAKARADTQALADSIISALHEAADPVAYLTTRLYPLVRHAQKLEHAKGETDKRFEQYEKRVRFLLRSGVAIHEQLLAVAAQLKVVRRLAAPGLPEGWLIWSNEHRAWWAPNSCGYVARMEQAGRYSLEAALSKSETRSRRADGTPNEVPVPSPELVACLRPVATERAIDGEIHVHGVNDPLVFAKQVRDVVDEALRNNIRNNRDGLATATADAVAGAALSLQRRVHRWMLACFGEAVTQDMAERNHRFLEEALELVQAGGCTESEARQLVEYVYGRPVGALAQEVGGVMVTLSALCSAAHVDMERAAEDELSRVWGKIEDIRAKQAAKPRYSPLPEAPATCGAEHTDGTSAYQRTRYCARPPQHASFHGDGGDPEFVWTGRHDDTAPGTP